MNPPAFLPFSSTERAQPAMLLIAGYACLLVACSPTFNWREVALDNAPVTVLLPCKPDHASRMVPLAGATRLMAMVGCEAGGATFTVAVIDVGDEQKVSAATQELRAMSKATHSQYLQHGSVLVQAAVYGQPNASRDEPGALSSHAVETFFTGLKIPAKP